MPHFFSDRLHGVDHSDPDIAWRYGKGNVLPISSRPTEQKNAVENIGAILEEYGFPKVPSVMLESQYRAMVLFQLKILY